MSTLSTLLVITAHPSVNAAPAPFSYSKLTSFLLHHADVDFTTILSARRGDTGPPCVARLGSGGWGVDMMRTVVDVDQEEWSALW